MWSNNFKFYNIFLLLASLSLLFLIPLTAKADIFTGLEFGQELPVLEPVVLGESDEVAVADEETLNQDSAISDLLVDEAGALADTQGGNDYIVKDPEDAVELQRLFLDTDTITKGYTVETEAGDFKAGVIPNAVAVPVTVILKQIPAWHIPVDKTDEKVSAIFDYDLRQCGGDENCAFANTESLGILDKPIYMAVKFDSDNYWKKVVHYWDRYKQEWIPIETTTDFDNNLARIEINMPYARLAVFEDNAVQEGFASWYAFRDCHCAASHIYKRGTKLKVTNISSSVRHGNYDIITVNDYGPDPNIHPDRPIDLDSHVYSHLAASLGSGLMLVRVEMVDPELAEVYEWINIKENIIAQN